MYAVGLDLGFSVDPTALAVVESVPVPTGKVVEVEVEPGITRPVQEQRPEYQLRYLERPELKTPYPVIVRRTESVCAKLDAPDARVPLLVDATGLGAQVVSLFTRPVTSVIITGGGHRGRREDGAYTVPKRDLVATLQVLIQTGRLKIAAGLKYGRLLVKEMENFSVKLTTSGAESYEAAREGEHDDLVLAASIACWWLDRSRGGLARREEWQPPAHGSPEWGRYMQEKIARAQLKKQQERGRKRRVR